MRIITWILALGLLGFRPLTAAPSTQTLTDFAADDPGECCDDGSGDDGNSDSDSGNETSDPNEGPESHTKITELSSLTPDGLDQATWFDLQKYSQSLPDVTDSALASDLVSKTFGDGAVLSSIPGADAPTAYAQYYVLKLNGSQQRLQVGTSIKVGTVTYSVTKQLGAGGEGVVKEISITNPEKNLPIAAKEVPATFDWAKAAPLMFDPAAKGFFTDADTLNDATNFPELTSIIPEIDKETAVDHYWEITVGSFLNRYPDNFVTTLGVATVGGSPVIMMKAEDGDLTSLITSKPSTSQQASYITQVLTDLNTMHENNLIHGDIGTGNFLYSRGLDGIIIADQAAQIKFLTLSFHDQKAITPTQRATKKLFERISRRS